MCGLCGRIAIALCVVNSRAVQSADVEASLRLKDSKLAIDGHPYGAGAKFVVHAFLFVVRGHCLAPVRLFGIGISGS